MLVWLETSNKGEFLMRFAQRFFTSFIALFFLGVFLLGVFASMAGCKPSEQLASKIAVQYAVGKYVERQPQELRAETAARISATADVVGKLVENDSVTIDSLRAYVAQRLGDRLSPADKLLAGAIIDAAAVELKARVGDGVIKPEQRIQVREVLSWVTEAAAAYAPPAGS